MAIAVFRQDGQKGRKPFPVNRLRRYDRAAANLARRLGVTMPKVRVLIADDSAYSPNFTKNIRGFRSVGGGWGALARGGNSDYPEIIVNGDKSPGWKRYPSAESRFFFHEFGHLLASRVRHIRLFRRFSYAWRKDLLAIRSSLGSSKGSSRYLRYFAGKPWRDSQSISFAMRKRKFWRPEFLTRSSAAPPGLHETFSECLAVLMQNGTIRTRGAFEKSFKHSLAAVRDRFGCRWGWTC